MLTAVAIVLYGISLPIVWYDRSCKVRPWIAKPPIYREALGYLAFTVARVAVAWGSIAGIAILVDPALGLLAFVIYWLVARTAFRRHYKRELARWSLIYTERAVQRRGLSSDAPVPPDIPREALDFAQSAVRDAMLGRRE